MKEYLTEHLSHSFITASNYLYTSPILFVKKPGSSLQFYIDYCKLNTLTKKDTYPIPRINKLLAQVSKAKIFTKLDIRQAFHRIRINLQSEDYTTFKTYYRTYKYKVLPFGLYNSPSIYQRYINNVLIEYLDDFYIAYLDNILIYSKNP